MSELHYIRCLLLTVSLLSFSANVAAQKKFLFASDATLKNEMDITQYLYYDRERNGQGIPIARVLDELHFNQAHSFYFHVKNTGRDSLLAHVRFGERYVMARNIAVYSFLREHADIHAGPTHTATVYLAPQEEILVSFTMSELDRINPDKITITFASAAWLEKTTHQIETTQSFFLGLFAFLVIFNLVLYIATGWPVYVRYVAYILSALLYFLYYYGFLQEVFPGIKEISTNLVSTWYYSVYILYFHFLNEFGQYREYSPWAHKLLNIGIINKIIQLIYESVVNLAGGEFIYSTWYKSTILIAEIILMVFIIYFIVKNKNVRGRIVIIGSLFLIAGAILGQLQIGGSYHGYLVQLGITGELLIFSVGLGYITKLHYQEKREAEQLYIAQLKATEKIQQDINEQLEQKVRERTEALEKKNHENEMLIGEIHHRVKNNLQVICSLINLKMTHSSTDTNAALQELNGRIFSMGLIHEKLLYQSDGLSSLRLDEYLEELSRHLMHSIGNPQNPVELELDCEPAASDAEMVLTCGIIVNELITNSLKHAFTAMQQKRKITVRLRRQPEYLMLEVSDNGECSRESTEKLKNSFGLRFVDNLVVSRLNSVWSLDTSRGFSATIKLRSLANG